MRRIPHHSPSDLNASSLALALRRQGLRWPGLRAAAAATAWAASAWAGPALAQSPAAAGPAAAPPAAARSEQNMGLALASSLAQASVAACAANGYAVTATVVDRAGSVRAVARADAAGPHTLDASRAKAYTAASARANTSAMMDNAQKNPAAAHLVHIPGFLLLGGGVPVRIGNEVIGAVGVGGAPGGHLDEQCAQAAIEQQRLPRS